MPVIRRIRKRNAVITVEAHGEVLFMPGGDVHNWANRFTARIRKFTIENAPSNKRPRWAHYGKPLKSSIVSTRPQFRNYAGVAPRVYAAVGSTAPYSSYVDQGTGVHAGNAPYRAKVLPPWHRGSPSLYESTWRPPSGGSAMRDAAVWARPAVARVMIRGQRGQFFFDAGLKRAFQSMRMRSYQVPADPRITDVLRSAPTTLADFIGNTPSDAAFRASLDEWREWRDAHFNSGRVLGRDGGYRSAEQRRRWDAARSRREAAAQRRNQRSAANKARRARLSAERSRRWREEQRRIKSLDKPAPNKKAIALKAEGERFFKAMDTKYESADRGTLKLVNGRWQVEVVYQAKDEHGRNVFRFKTVYGKSTVE